MAIINVRSPKYVSIDDGSLSYAILRLSIWTGASSPSPAPTYIIRKSGTFIVFFEIAELIRDYLDTTFDGNYSGQAVWVSTTLLAYDSDDNEVADDGESFVAFDGYNYFEESANVSNPIMITNRNLSVLKDNTFKIPIYTTTSPSVGYYVNGQLTSTVTYLSSNQSDEQIEYISILNNDKITVTSAGNTQTINIEILEECKYEPKKVTFVNKYGALQDMIFFKKAVERINVERETYKSNILDSNMVYNSSNHVYRDFNVMGRESVTLSSGFLSEEYNEVFKQMMLSEKVWVTNVVNSVEQVLPINVKTSDITYKTSLNDKLVEYTIEFDKSFDTINNIR